MSTGFVLIGYYQVPQDLIEWMLGKEIEVESIGGLPLFSWERPKSDFRYSRSL